MKKILITGATGFIGLALLKRLIHEYDVLVRATVRRMTHNIPTVVETVQVKGLTPVTNFKTALNGIDTIIHLAGRAHISNKIEADFLGEYRKINVDGTLNLARQAIAAGVTRFIFISSIGVNGNHNDHPFTENDIPNPIEPYAISKMEAEEGLRKLSTESGLETIIIRPPLVYGSNAPGNFGRLSRIVKMGFPLPLGAVKNKRTLVAIDNLVDLIVTCIDHPAAANQLFLAGDGEDLSTTDLLRRMAEALGKKIYLVPVPVNILEFGARLSGKQDIIHRLCGSLRVDISKAQRVLGWTPPVSVEEGLKTAVEGERGEMSETLF